MKKLVSVLVALVVMGITATTVSAAEYEVQKGDSLWKIATEHDTTVEVLMELNELKSTLIHPKQILKLEDEEKNAELYMVQKGDTLIHISNVYGDDVTVEKLKEWNNLSSDLIIVGQSLNVNGVGVESIKTKMPEQSANETAATKSVESSAVEPVSKPAPVEKVEKEESVEKQQVESPKVVEETPKKEVNGKTFAVEATAYTAQCTGCSGITATGINLNNNRHAKVIAVDPNVIPLGSEVYVEGYGYAVAGDTGGAIKGNKIDIHVPTKKEAYSWGRRTVEITILN